MDDIKPTTVDLTQLSLTEQDNLSEVDEALVAVVVERLATPQRVACPERAAAPDIRSIIRTAPRPDSTGTAPLHLPLSPLSASVAPV
ncbi:hypothetical protein HK44_017635 [Pseudomonas fluorescens HK44]|uniref:FXSXX-COOH protein n=1 Tax=Pseudomonas fluorescens HK44 TaxID=1042209 RepID=A0A010SJQ8_PSEFL|nr:hypothetical protein HK44_017635 [Pseudomonas fluorescens HK44]